MQLTWRTRHARNPALLIACVFWVLMAAQPMLGRRQLALPHALLLVLVL